MVEKNIESPFALLKDEMLGIKPAANLIDDGFKDGGDKSTTGADKGETAKTSEKETGEKTDAVLSEAEITDAKRIADEQEAAFKAEEAAKAGQTKEAETVEGTFQIFAKQLADKGIISVDIPEDMEDTDEALEALITASNKKKYQDEYVNSLPEDGKKFLDFLKDGGDPKQFLDIYYGNISVDELDMTLEENQKYVIEQALTVAGQSPEEIVAAMTDYEDNGLLAKEANRGLKVLQKMEKQNKDLILETQKNLQKKKLDAYNAEIEEIKSSITKADNIKGFTLSPAEKTKLIDYITKIVDKKTGKTQMTLDYEADKETQLIFSYLSMKKWDMTALEKGVKSKVTSALKEKLNNSQTTGRQKTTKGSSDVNMDDNPFAAFGEAMSK